MVGSIARRDLNFTRITRHISNRVVILNKLDYGNHHRTCGDEEDAGRIIVVIVIRPQGDGEHLEDVEGIKDFFDEEAAHRGWGHLYLA